MPRQIRLEEQRGAEVGRVCVEHRLQDHHHLLPVSWAHCAVGEHPEQRQDPEDLIHHRRHLEGRLVFLEIVRELREAFPKVVDLRANVSDHCTHLLEGGALVLLNPSCHVVVQRVQAASSLHLVSREVEGFVGGVREPEEFLAEAERRVFSRLVVEMLLEVLEAFHRRLRVEIRLHRAALHKLPTEAFHLGLEHRDRSEEVGLEPLLGASEPVRGLACHGLQLLPSLAGVRDQPAVVARDV
mmetsp:Transcript_58454/g.139663  ORF Transcript_58454/g.139663 Transcript_58454/m.139663 type:complete len:241 (-) Transcript_58454:428-1150(-)